MDNDTLINLKINCIVLKHTDECPKELKICTHREEINYIVSHPKRNNFIKNYVKI